MTGSHPKNEEGDMAEGAVYFVTFTGQGVVELKGAGLFASGTSAYVDEEAAQAAKAMGGFSVTAPSAAPARAPAPAAAAPKPAPKVEEKKPEPAPKAEEKKPEAAPKAEEKKPEPVAADAAKG
jgi:hypothetical protein